LIGLEFVTPFRVISLIAVVTPNEVASCSSLGLGELEAGSTGCQSAVLTSKRSIARSPRRPVELMIHSEPDRAS
jgi:hypothetical protein